MLYDTTVSYVIEICLLQILTSATSVIVTVKQQLVPTPWAVISAIVNMDINMEATKLPAKVHMLTSLID